MTHLKINSHVGHSFLLSHTPHQCYTINKRAISIGNQGELLIWGLEGKNFTPLFTLIPTLNHEAGNLVSFAIINTITTIFESYPSYKIVTVHEDNRLRVWNWDDGICSTVSPVGLFDSTIKGVCSDLDEARFAFTFSESYIYGVDLWKMSIICRIKPSGNIHKVVKDYKRLMFQDTIKRIQTVDVTEITKEKWNEPMNMLANQDTAAEQMKNAFRKFDVEDKIKDSEEIILPKEFILPNEDALKSINEYTKNQSEKNQIEQLFSVEFKKLFPAFIEQIKKESITQSSLLFINKQIPYFFFGCESGKLYGVPLMMNTSRLKVIIFESRSAEKQVRFLDINKNMLICSLINQKVLIFNLGNMESAILNQIKIPSNSQLIRLELQKFLIIEAFLSSPIKYKLQTYQLLKTDILHVDGLFSFELQNKQVMMFNPKDRSIKCLRGFTRNHKILAILLFDYFIGVITNTSISIFKENECFQRVITYEDWEWKNYSLQEKPEFKKDYHNYQSFKRQNPFTYLADYSIRYLQCMLDYTQSKEQLMYQIFGKFNDQKIPNEQFPNFYFRNRPSTLSIEYSEHADNAVSILRMLRNRDRRRCWENTSYIVHTDIRKQLDKLTSSQDPVDSYKTSLPFIFPWYIDQNLSNSLKRVIGGDVPTLSTQYCFQGIGTSFTVYLSNPFNISNFLASYKAMCIMDYFITLCAKDPSNNLSDAMYKCVQYFTKKKHQSFQSLSISSLSQLTVSASGNIVNTGCNLLISTVVGKEKNLTKVEDYFILNLKRLQDTKSKQLTTCEVWLMLTIGFTYLYSNNNTPNERVELLINRIISAIDLINFQKVPELVAINMKILNEGMQKWKPLIEPGKVYILLNNLFVIYFLYDGLGTLPKDDRKFNFALESNNQVLIRRMKQVIIKTIVYVSQHFSNEFLQVLKKQAVNQQIHPSYPSSVVQILRQYIKSQKPTKHLGFYVELLLKCLSPTTPQLRKYVQKNVTQTLHLMCTYKNISFNQPSQKLALVTDNHVYIYDLRTATKWRTIDIDKSSEGQYSVEMSPKGSYIAVLGNQLKIWRLSNSLWSGVLGAFSQGWTFNDVMGKVIKWDQNQHVITVEAPNPVNTRTFTL